VLDGLHKHGPRRREVIAGIEQPVDLRAVFGPLLNLIKVVIIREKRIVGFLVRPVVIHLRRTISVRIVAMVALKRRVDFSSGWMLPILRVAQKIIDHDIHYLLTIGVLWQAKLMSSCKRIDGSNDERDASCLLRRLVGHFAKPKEVIAV
jgi:hypothetical protein